MLKSVVMAYHFVGPDGPTDSYVIGIEYFFQLELMEYRQGKRVVGADGEETTNDMYHENTMLNKENSHLRTRIKALQETVDVLTAKNSQLLADKEVGNWIRENGSIGSRYLRSQFSMSLS